MGRYFLLATVVLAVGVLAYFTFRTTVQLDRLRQQSVVEATLGLASEKADRLDKRLVEEDNVAVAMADPVHLGELSDRWLPTALRETPTIRAILVLGESSSVLAFASRASGPWSEEEAFRRLLLGRIVHDMKLDEQPLDELRHLHRAYSGQSYLLSYWQRQWSGRKYTIVAWHDLGRIVKYVFPQLYSEGTAGVPSKVNVVDEDGRIIYGPPLRTGQFTVAVRFPSTIYNWRLQISPTASEELAVRVRSRHLLELVTFVLSFIVIVVAVFATVMAAERQRRMSQLKSDFVANVSHELKTPLALIRMFGEMLQTGRVANDAKRKEYLDIIVQESERLSSLIENVLDFARLEGGSGAYEMRPGDVATAVRSAANVYRYRLEAEEVSLIVHAPETLPDDHIDERAIQLAVINLIDNAVKHAPGSKQIVVSVEVTDKDVSIRVTDQGPGIAANERERIFERFERSRSTLTSSKVRGSGIGLALVRHVADSHGGRAFVEPSPQPPGACFVVQFPRTVLP